jgi:hypothetical protein
VNDVVKVPEAPALGISVQLEFPGGTLVFQTHVDAATTKEQLDSKVDTLIAVVERQRAKNQIVELKRNRQSQMAQLTGLRDDRARLDEEAATVVEGRRVAKPNETQKRARDQSVVMEGKLIDIIKRFDAEIAEAEAVVAGK